MERYCTLGRNRTNDCRPGEACLDCGWDNVEQARRLAMVRAGDSLKVNKKGLTYLCVRRRQEEQ